MKKSIVFFSLILTFFLALNVPFVCADENNTNPEQEKLDQLIQDLSSPDWSTRAVAAELLGGYRDNEKAFNALIQALNDDEYMVLTYVLISLKKHQNPVASEKIMSNLLWEHYPIEDSIQISWLVLPLAFKTIGSLGASSAEEAISLVEDIFAYFLFQSPLNLFNHGIREEATRTLFALFKDLPKESAVALYKKWGPHLLKANEGDFPLESSQFARESAWLFLNVLKDNPTVTTELLNTMVNIWSSNAKWEFMSFYPTSEQLTASPITVRGKLDDQGRFIGRLGQFVLKDEKGNTVVQIHVSKERITDLYRLWGKEVLLTGVITMTQGLFNPFRKDMGLTHPFHLEFTDIKRTQ